MADLGIMKWVLVAEFTAPLQMALPLNIQVKVPVFLLVKDKMAQVRVILQALLAVVVATMVVI